MKIKGIAAYVLITVMTVFLLGCGNSKNGTASSADAASKEMSTSALTREQQDEGVKMEEEAQPSVEQETESEEMTGSDSGEQTTEETPEKMLQLKIADTVVEVAWEDNESVEELRKLCEEEPLTIQMAMYGGFEQVGEIGTSLPRNDVQTTTEAGDIVLYSGDRIVVFYGSNSWAYTRLGHITDQDEEGMTQLLGNGDVTITVSMEHEASNTSTTSATVDNGLRDLYAMETYDTVPEELLERHDDVDYGTIDSDVEYYSETAGDNKYCNVLLPAGYDESQEYPVLYMIHGWGGMYDTHVYEGASLQTLYGNMLSEGLAVPMIIVGVDMYTDPLADKDSKTEEEMRLSYDKTVDDIGLDLMPFIEERYSVKTGRLSTAVSGVSQGATTSLATGFKWQSKIAYIASLAPDPGVIPTPYYEGTYWNWPIFDEFTIESPETMPRYIYLTVGTEDPWNIEVTAYYGQEMDKKGIPNQNDLVEGYGHDGDFWSLGHYNFLQKIFLD